MAVIGQIVQPRMIYIHKETTNKSFLDMHHYLKSIGVQNNDFFLALIDTGLAGVDPRDPNLPSFMKARILQEVRNNYWYFLREVVRIPVQGGDVKSGDRFKLHRGNLAMNFLYMLNFNMFVEMPRQHGKTVAALCRYLWVYNFGTSNSEIMFMHKDHNGSKNNLKTLKNIRDALPSYLQMSTVTGADGKKLKVPNSITTIQHPYNNNKITTFASARSKDAADNLGRGATIPLQYYDEFAFMPWNSTVYLAAVPAFSTASMNAARNHAPYGIVLTTTPGDLLTDSGNFAYQIRNGAIRWTEKYYDLSLQELIGLRDSNKENTFFLISYTYQQLGSGQDYFKRMVREMGRVWPKIRREVMLEWSQIADDCPFSTEDLDIIATHVKQPIRTLLFGQFKQYQFDIYEDIDTSYPPIIGVDVAGATYHDSSAITVIDSKTTRVGATLNCNYMPQDDLAQVLYELVTKYLPNAVINVERNGGFGNGVVQYLCKTSIKKNLYWEIKEKVLEESFQGARLIKRPQKVRVYGLDSNKSVRSRLIEILHERVRYHKDKFVAPIILDEMKHMVVKKSGKVEHSDNSHDDQVFSYLMALYVWYDGKNLAENFRIVKNTIKTDEDAELIDNEIEEHVENLATVDIDRSDIYDENSDISQALDFIEKNAKYITTKDLREDQYLEIIRLRNSIFDKSKQLREKYAAETGVDPIMFEDKQHFGQDMVVLPNSVFDIESDGLDMFDDNGNYTRDVIQGNLAEQWRRL